MFSIYRCRIVFLFFLVVSSNSNGACQFKAHKLGSLKQFSLFLDSANKNFDRHSLKDFVRFPLRVNQKGVTKYIETEIELGKNFERIFGTLPKNIFQPENLENVFCNYQGLMLAKGRIWISYEKEYKIFAINIR